MIVRSLAVLFLFVLSGSGAVAQLSEVDLDSLKQEMGRDGIYYGPDVGHTHAKMPQFEAFELFLERSSLEQKIECLNSKDPVVQAYSFLALALTDSLRASEEIKHIKRRKKKLNYRLYGCIVGTCKLEVLLRGILLDPQSYVVPPSAGRVP